MYSVKLEIKDCVFDKVIYFLQNLPNDEYKSDISDIKVYSDHSANLIEGWEESSEDDIWN